VSRLHLSAGRVAAVASLLLLAAVGWLALSGWRMVDGLATARDERSPLKEALRDQDWAAAELHARRMADGAADAARASSSPPLVAASGLPLVGDDLAALRTTARAADLAASGAAVPLAAGLQALTAPIADGATVPLDRLEAAAPTAAAAASAASRAADQMEDIPRATLLEGSRHRVEEATEDLRDLADRAALLDLALGVLPGALGADGPREYLIGFQNLAEARPTGGIVGAWALVQMADGRPVLAETGANDDLEELRGPVRDLGPEAAALYGQQLAPSPNLNLSPHVPQAGVLLSDLWVSQGRPAPDAVVFLDPVGLATMLGPEASVEVPGGPPITEENLVKVLLRDVYRTYDGHTRGRTEYLSRVTGAVFERVLDDGLLLGPGLRRVAEAAEDGHVLAWSPDSAEQALFEKAGVAGSLPEPAPDDVGVYLTNADASKLDYYLDVNVRTVRACAGRGPSVEVVLGNKTPRKVPEYVGHHLDNGSPVTTHRVLLTFLLPPERGVDRIAVDGQTTTLASGTERGWTVVRSTVEVPRAQSRTVDVELSGLESAPVRVRTQPMVRRMDVTTGVSCS
jgi:hypothetical protein